MIFNFILVSDEVDDFVRIISIRDDATFIDLHNAILESVDYDDNLLTSFFLCTDDWEKEQEITLIDMGIDYEDDSCTMSDTLLKDLLTKEKQKLLYVFDVISERLFFIELSEILDETLPEVYQIVQSIGEPPSEEFSEEELFGDEDLNDIFADDDEFDDVYDGEYDDIDIDSIDFDDSDFY